MSDKMQNRAQNAPCFFAERAEISAEMRVFLNSAQKIRRTEKFFAERRTQNARFRNEDEKHKQKPAQKALWKGGFMLVLWMDGIGLKLPVIL